ncbi:DUF6493 family protein [Actinoplanes sp. L3-i22]|uniref:DUF7824 domain-containing protein n=1 Tax=Actinoplanes sp. L3-i22 TaxID=2836373 RepID=UPI001C762232|nr:DUF6493 family protein [Actinoplanes sp. L3-i22]BCY07866.1 hypothetical protein L3i22_029540 [Actinoplanes sp. L3-i22]
MTTPLTWIGLERRANRDDLAGIIMLLAAATEEERLALAKEVEAGIKKLDRDTWWRGDSNPTQGLALAVIGTMPTAARAATLLLRGNMRFWGRVGPQRFLQVARLREVPWLGELGQRLAQRLPIRDAWNGEWEMITALLRAAGAEPPVTEAVVRAWVRELLQPRRDGRLPPLVIRLRDHPFLHLLLPGVFEIDGIGADLAGGQWNATTNEWDNTPPISGVVAALVAEGTLERKTVLDLTVDRLLRGGKPHDLRAFTLMHDLLEPTLDELAGHALDYARLLPEAPGTVAGLAQKALRTVDDAGRLELETLLDTSGPTLVRKEKTLVKAQLTWLEKVARRDPDRAGEVLETVAAAFGHPGLDVQERALTLIGKQIGRLDAATVARLGDAAVVLAGDLPARAAELFGTTAATEPAELPELPPAAPPAAMPPPITSAAELAEELTVLRHDQTAVGFERVLAGLVTLFTTEGPAALGTALQPVLDRYPGDFTENTWNRSSPLMHLGTAIRSAIDPAARTLRQWMVDAVRTAWQNGRRGGEGSMLAATPDGVLALRVAEAGLQLTSTMIPELMATPTHVTGSIDTAVLLERLRRAEAEGWQPWPVDLEQALLRLPRENDPAVVARATELTSPAGRQFAAWLTAGGLPDPISRPFPQAPISGKRQWQSDVLRRTVTILKPARDGGLRLERQLLTTTPGPEPDGWPDEFATNGDVLAMVLPHHREASAAWALPRLASLADQDQRGGSEVLPLLAECSGPVGPSLAYGLAYVLGARHQEDRVAAVDAFVILATPPAPLTPAPLTPAVGVGPATRPAPLIPAVDVAPATRSASFAPAVGAALADLCVDGTIKLSRVLPGLAEAHRAGASVAVWETLTAFLPTLLSAPATAPGPATGSSSTAAGKPASTTAVKPASAGGAATVLRGLPDLLELATQVAGAVRARTEIPGLAEVASRPGSTRLIKEAKRLQTVLNS